MACSDNSSEAFWSYWTSTRVLMSSPEMAETSELRYQALYAEMAPMRRKLGKLEREIARMVYLFSCLRPDKD